MILLHKMMATHFHMKPRCCYITEGKMSKLSCIEKVCNLVKTMVRILDGSSEHRKYVINRVLRFVEGIWLDRKCRQIKNFLRKRPILLNMCATCSELPSYTSTIALITRFL